MRDAEKTIGKMIDKASTSCFYVWGWYLFSDTGFQIPIFSFE